jgi:hypothetical protein
MAVTLICPHCEASTELRGSMDAWYLTWCPECERLWRLDFRTLLDDLPGHAIDAPSLPRHTRARAGSST